MRLLLILLCAFSTYNRCHAFNKEISRSLAQLKKNPSYSYPANELVEKIKKQNDRIAIFVYGSLMNPASAKTQLSQKAIDSMRLAICLGCKRLFDRDVPWVPESRWPEPKNPLSRGMLNLRSTLDAADFVNGIVVEISSSELEALIKREEGYALIPVVIMDWEKALVQNKSCCEIAYAFSAPKGSIYTSPDIVPIEGYLGVCEEAAKAHGDLFFYLWLQTTYFADESTNLAKCTFNSK